MRVLMTAHAFYPEGQGGVEKHILTLSHYLMEKGHAVGIFYRIHSPSEPEYALIQAQWEHIRAFKVVHNYTSPLPNPYPYYDLRVEERFVSVLDEYAPDVVHIHHLGELSTSLIGAAKAKGVPVVWTVHDFWPMCPRSYLMTPNGRLCPGPDGGLRCVGCLWLESQEKHRSVSMRARLREIGWKEGIKRAPRFFRDLASAWVGARHPAWDASLTLPVRDEHMRRVMLEADLLISPSRFLIDQFEKWGIPRSRFRHLPNGMPPSLFSARRMPIDTRRPFTFGFVGTLHPHKGVHVLIDAFLRAQLPEAVLRIWGSASAPQVQEYVASVRQKASGHRGITFEGPFPPEQVADVLDQMDVLVMPSIWYENNPLIILEAFARGVPVIAGNVGGMAELVHHDRNGLQFRVGDPVDLADKMRMVIDPERLERYRAGIQPPRSMEETGAELVRIYEDLMG